MNPIHRIDYHNPSTLAGAGRHVVTIKRSTNGQHDYWNVTEASLARLCTEIRLRIRSTAKVYPTPYGWTAYLD